MSVAGAQPRLNRALYGVAIIGIVAAVAALLVWSSRPRWRTFTFPADPKIGVAVAIDYPDDWTLDPRKMEPTSFAPSVSFRPAKPNTFAQWCQEHLFGKKPVNSPFPTIRFMQSPLPLSSDEMAAVWTRSSHSASPYFDRTQPVRRMHTLGPEFDVTQHFTGIPFGKTTLDGISYQTLIFLNDRDPNRRTVIMGNCFIPSGPPLLLEGQFRKVVARIHLVHVPMH